jgi:hypothetical protein
MQSIRRAPQKFTEKVCANCGKPFMPTSGRQKRCEACQQLGKSSGSHLSIGRAPWIRELESVPCRQCGAKPGYRCIRVSGTIAYSPHSERRDDAMGILSEASRREVRLYEEQLRAQRNVVANTRRRRIRRQAKQYVLEHYGTACACCGATADLTIDHINGDGKQHRQIIGGGSHVIYAWLIKNDFPHGFQTLCRLCNTSKRDGERCLLDHSVIIAADYDPDGDSTFPKVPPLDIKWRARGGLAAWLRAEAKRRRTTHRAILTEAIRHYRGEVERKREASTTGVPLDSLPHLRHVG